MIRELDTPPIIIGHSAGGAFTQVLLDHGYGAAGVALNSAPTEGVRVVPLVAGEVDVPRAEEPGQPPQGRAAHVRAVELRVHQHVRRGAVRSELYERYAIPASGRILWDSVLANFQPGHQGIWVDYHNDDRAPLLFVSGTDDHIMPPKIQQSNLKHYKSDTVTEIIEFEGPHLLPAIDGWEKVADHALDWALEAANAPARELRSPASERRERRPGHPHRGTDGPASRSRAGGSSRSHLRPAGPDLHVRLGHVVDASSSGPAVDVDDAASRRRRAAHATTTTPTTSTTPAGRCLPSAGTVVTTVPGAHG